MYIKHCYISIQVPTISTDSVTLTKKSQQGYNKTATHKVCVEQPPPPPPSADRGQNAVVG